MEKDNWINEVLESSRGIKPQEPGSFLFEQISAKIERRKSESSGFMNIPKGWAVASVLIVVINLASIVFIMKQQPVQQKEMGYTSLSNDMGLNNSYNY
jgi:hypothetical protein